MNAYALSQKEDSTIQTRRLLLDLIQEGPGQYFESGGKDKINAYPFTIVLKAAANAKENDSSSGESTPLEGLFLAAHCHIICMFVDYGHFVDFKLYMLLI